VLAGGNTQQGQAELLLLQQNPLLQLSLTAMVLSPARSPAKAVYLAVTTPPLANIYSLCLRMQSTPKFFTPHNFSA